MNIDQLAPDEPLSPELVLVLAPELRAQVLAALPAPVWRTPRAKAVAVPPRAAAELPERSLGAVLVTRVAHLVLIFLAITILTLAVALVAQAVR